MTGAAGRIREYLAHVVPPVAGGGRDVPAAAVLVPLALAEEPGLPAELWRVALRALGSGDVPEGVLGEFGRSVATALLVEPEGDGPGTVFRLSSKALADALREASTVEQERAVVEAFLAAGREAGWDRAPDYLLRSLPAHAARAGLVDGLLADDGYLLHAVLDRVLKVADGATTPAGRSRAQLLRRSPNAATASPAERAAMFSVTAAVRNLGHPFRADELQAPYDARWAVATPSGERGVLRGHENGISAVCTVVVDDRPLLASGDHGGAVRLWDPQTGRQTAVLDSPGGDIRAMCTIPVDGRDLLATGDYDGTVRLWDPQTGQQTAVLAGHQDHVHAVCVITVDDRLLLASGDYDGTVRLWDPRTGQQTTVLEGCHRTADSLCAVTFVGRQVLAVGSINEDEVRLVDPRDGRQVAVTDEFPAHVNALCTVMVGSRELLAIGVDTPEAFLPEGPPGTLRLLDVPKGREVAVVDGDAEGVYGVCTITVDGREVLAYCGSGGFKEMGGTDGTVRLWDHRDDAVLTGARDEAMKGHRGSVHAVCAVPVGDRQLLASGGADNTVRLWDTRHGGWPALLDGDPGAVNAVCAITVDDRQLVATGCEDNTVRLLDARDGRQTAALEGHRDWVWSVCTVTVAGRQFLASGSRDRTVRLWDPRDGHSTVLEGHREWVNAVCVVRVDGQELVASGSEDHTVRLWDPRDGRQVGVLEGHQDEVMAVCAITVDGRELLASGSLDKTIRLWDPQAGEQVAVLEGHEKSVWTVCAYAVDGRQFLASGGNDNTIRLWDPQDGRYAVIKGHDDLVTQVCVVTVDGRELLASGSRDKTVRLWEPLTGECSMAIPTHYGVNRLAAVSGSLAIAMDAGILLVDPHPAAKP